MDILFDVLTGKGIFQLEWWGYVILALVLTHLTIVSVTLYLHRCQAHRSVEFHPGITHFMRMWLWLTTGLVTLQWVAVHRKHHATVETEEDPHSPVIHGINKVLYQGADLYRYSSHDQEILDKFSHDKLPDDWLERNVYSPASRYGIFLLLMTEFILLGFFGIAVWAVQMAWIPFFAAGVINGLGHHAGYRNFECDDSSTNVSSIGILIGGEELHNNHHAYPSSAKFSLKWWEFDIGWLYIKLLEPLGLAKVLRVAPMPKRKHQNLTDVLTPNTLGELIRGRPHVLDDYVNQVIRPVFKAEYVGKGRGRAWVKQVKNALYRHKRHTDEKDWDAFAEAIKNNPRLKAVCEFKASLEDLMTNCRDQNSLLEALQEWCHKAEQSGIQVLATFSQRLRNYPV